MIVGTRMIAPAPVAEAATPDASADRAGAERFDDVLATVGDKGARHAPAQRNAEARAQRPGTDARAADAKPTDAKPTESKPTDAEPNDAKPLGADPSGTEPAATKATDAGPAGGDLAVLLARAAATDDAATGTTRATSGQAATADASTGDPPDATHGAADAAGTTPQVATTAAAPVELLNLLAATLAPAGGTGPTAQGTSRLGIPGSGAASRATPAGIAAGTAATLPIPAADATVSLSHVAVTGQIAPARMPVGATDDAVPGAAPSTAPAGGGDATASGTAAAAGDGAVAVSGPQPATGSGAPVPPPGAVLPVVNAVAGAVKALAETAAPSRAAEPPADKTTTALAPARTLTLQLSPSNLGTVSIRLHVAGTTLDVGLTVSDPQTLGLMRREHDALAGALRDATYDLNSLTIQGAAATPAGDQNAQSRSFASGQNGGGQPRPEGDATGRSARDGGGGRNGPGTPADAGGDAGDPRRDSVDGAAGSGALFV